MIKSLLNIPPGFSDDDIIKRFYLLASILFNQYEIVKGKSIYHFLEIEFYLYSNNHQDKTTYQRTLPGGKWHTHLSGVDISFESYPDCYGGILIRSIIDNEGNSINGPLCTLNVLFDNIDIEDVDNLTPKIIFTKSDRKIPIEKTTRFNISTGGFQDRQYRYYNASPYIKWKAGYIANPMKTHK